MDENNNQPIHPTVLDECESVRVEEVSGELADKLRKKIRTKWDSVTVDESEYLDPTKPFTDIDWAISIHGKGVFAFDDYNYLQGQAGNGKSMTMCIYESVILGSNQFNEIKYIGNRDHAKVLHIDTEQSVGNVQLHKARVYYLAGWDQDSDHRDQFRILMLRQTPSPEERWAKIIRACYDFHPDFLFLDGMLDVVVGMNKEEECNMVISEAGALSEMFKLCMVGICHENPENSKSSDGPAKPAGHIGSYSQRKGSAGQSTKKKLIDETPSFDVIPKKVRNKDYNGFSFSIKDVTMVIGGKQFTIGVPYTTNIETDEETNDNDVLSDDNVRGAIQSVLSNTERVSMTALRERIRVRYKIGSGKAKEVIDRAVVIGFIECVDNKYNIIRTEDEDAPF